MQDKIVIGIDPGVNTGVGVLTVSGVIVGQRSLKIHDAMEWVYSFAGVAEKQQQPLFVVVEDARKCKYIGPNGSAARMGVGSVKRDCQIWEEFLTARGINFVLVDPRKNKLKKLKTEQLEKYIGQTLGRCSQHARDAIGLAWLHTDKGFK